MSNQKSHECGFTFIEILVALVVIATVFMAALGGLAAIARSRKTQVNINRAALLMQSLISESVLSRKVSPEPYASFISESSEKISGMFIENNLSVRWRESGIEKKVSAILLKAKAPQ